MQTAEIAPETTALFAREVLGRKARTAGEVDQTVQPLVDAGLLVIARPQVALKGCPGGRPRPATVTRTYYRLTEAGRAAGVEWKKAHPERLTPFQRKVLGV